MNAAVAAKHSAKDKAVLHRANHAQPSPELSKPWPLLPLAEWTGTCDTLHLWIQVVGKVRLCLTPLINHWWNVPLYVTSRGLSTSPIPHGVRTFEIHFDFVDHQLRVEASDGATEQIALRPMSVADFYTEVMASLARLGIQVHIWTMPSEIENAIPFELDRGHAHYDAAMVERFWRALVQVDRLFKLFRARFIGKVSPVHFFWGSFDLTVTRFSGRTALAPAGVYLNVAQWVMAEAYSHEVCSCGFWPGTAVTAGRRSTSMPTPNPPASPRPSCAHRRPSTTKASSSLSCLTTRSVNRPTRRSSFWASFRKLMTRRPHSESGIGKRSSGNRCS